MNKPFSKLFELIEKNNDQPNKDELVSIRLEHIVPNRYQPRTEFNPLKIKELAKSIDKHGLLQPITVRPIEEDMYEIVAGERRYRAMRKLGFGETDAIVRYLTDDETAAVALIENIQREDLSPIEEAVAYERLLKIQGITQKNLAESMGKSQSFIANKLRLLKLGEDVKKALQNFEITERHARALIPLDEATQVDMVKHITRQSLNVKETEDLVDTRKNIRGELDFTHDVSYMMNDLFKEIGRIEEKGLRVETEEADCEGYKEVWIRVYK